MLGPFATASRRTSPVLHCHSPGVATVERRHCRTSPAHRCPRRRQQRQRVTEGTAMAPWNGPNKWHTNKQTLQMMTSDSHLRSLEAKMIHKLQLINLQRKIYLFSMSTIPVCFCGIKVCCIIDADLTIITKLWSTIPAVSSLLKVNFDL